MANSFDTLGWFSNNKDNMLKVGKVFFNNFKKFLIKEKNIVIPIDMIDNIDYELKSQFLSYCDNKFKKVQKVRISSLKKSDLADCFRIIQGYEIKHNILPWIKEFKPKISNEINSRFKMVETLTLDEYENAIDLRKIFINEIEKNLPDGYFAIFPTVPCSAPLKGMSNYNLAELRKKIMEFTSIGGLSSRPQINIPKFKGKTGPIGLSVLGYKGSDEIILNNLREF